MEKLAASLEVYRPDGSPRPMEETPPLRALQGEGIRSQEEMIRTAATGELRYRQVSFSPVRDAVGNIIGSVSVVRDITELKRMEDELRRSRDKLELRVQERTAELAQAIGSLEAERQRFHDVLNMLPAYVVLLTPDYRVPFANRFFEERFGKSEGRRCYGYLFNRTEPCEICETYRVLKTNAPHRWEWTGPDGCLYDIYDFPFTDVDGSQLIMETGLDITERKRAEDGVRKAYKELVEEIARREKAEQQLLQAQKLESIGTLTGGIAHDLNNILGPVVINSEMALLDLPVESRLRSNLKLILD